MLYRPHRGSLDAAMREVIEVIDRAGLIKHLTPRMAEWGLSTHGF